MWKNWSIWEETNMQILPHDMFTGNDGTVGKKLPSIALDLGLKGCLNTFLEPSSFICRKLVCST